MDGGGWLAGGWRSFGLGVHLAYCFSFLPSDSFDPFHSVPRLIKRLDQIKIGTTTFSVLSRATRCTATCVDPHTATTALEPLKTLQSYRRVDPHARFEACFGMWLQQHAVGGWVAVGDEVQVVALGVHAKKKRKG